MAHWILFGIVILLLLVATCIVPSTSQGSDTRVDTQKEPGGFFLGKPTEKKPGQKIHFKSNCILLFNNQFCYFEVLKPISRTLLSISRYSKVLVSIIKPKTQQWLVENNLPTNVFISHICDISTTYWYNSLFCISNVSSCTTMYIHNDGCLLAKTQ